MANQASKHHLFSEQTWQTRNVIYTLHDPEGSIFLVSDIVGKVPIWVSLPFITTVVLVSILASLWRTSQKRSDEFASPG
jgi:hypothetical protein